MTMSGIEHHGDRVGGRFVDALIGKLGPERVLVDLDSRKAASKDYSWLSPILSQRLPASLPDVVVRPGSVDEITEVIGDAHQYRVPITTRGRGTSNYGQVVPLQNGVVIDTCRFNRILDIGDGWIRAEAGASFVALEEAARSAGQELAIFPSTVNSTLGGFIAGGSGGTGSIENGFNNQGFVLALDVLPCVDAPELVTIEGNEAVPFIHTYGTTGVLVTLTVKLVKARTWCNLWASLATMQDAAWAARQLMAQSPRPRLVSVTEPALVRTFPPSLGIPGTLVSLRAVVELSLRASAERIIRDAGGRLEVVLPPREVAPSLLSFNHVTLRAKQARPELYHIQIRRPPIETLDIIHAAAPGSMLHLDGLRLGMETGFAGLLLAPYVDETSVYDVIERLRALGVTVIDPHTWVLGSHLPDAEAWDRLLGTAARFDPDGLLNPGRIPWAKMNGYVRAGSRR